MSGPSFAGKDAFLRMNYLYQLSNKCATGQIPECEQLANLYNRQLIAISKKTVQRIEPAIKRRICKTCYQYLIPGKTCKVRVRKKVVIHKCLFCKREKRFKATPGYQTWYDNPEALVDVITV